MSELVAWLQLESYKVELKLGVIEHDVIGAG